MKRSLSRRHHPPAPIVSLEIGALHGGDTAFVEAKVDTGADMCTIPDWVVTELDMTPIRTIQAAGFSGGFQPRPVYGFRLKMGDLKFSYVEAVAVERPYAIVGRSVLQHLLLKVDGPAEILQLSRPRRRAA